MNKYKSIYLEDILSAERKAVKAVVTGNGADENKVATIIGIMTLVDCLTADEEEEK